MHRVLSLLVRALQLLLAALGPHRDGERVPALRRPPRALLADRRERAFPGPSLAGVRDRGGEEPPEERSPGAEDAAVEFDDSSVRRRDVVPRGVLRVDGAEEGEQTDDGDDTGAGQSLAHHLSPLHNRVRSSPSPCRANCYEMNRYMRCFDEIRRDSSGELSLRSFSQVLSL